MSKHLPGFVGGWRPDPYDSRDFPFLASRQRLATLPDKVDLSLAHRVPIYDQGQLGSCTANAIASAIQYDRATQGLADFIPSRLFLYYCERAMEGTVNEDAGAMIRDGIKCVATLGDCPEPEWPYTNIARNFKVKPSAKAYASALRYTAVQYQRISVSNGAIIPQIEACIAGGHPFVFGINVYPNFPMSGNGHIPMPEPGTVPEGGHALKGDSYNHSEQWVEGPNSWGSKWGNKGRFRIPYKYLADPKLASDFWKITLVR
jgi:C1A family cysteine protease